MELERALDVARRAVEAAAKASLPHFERGVLVEKKADRSPVTAADRESEAAILGVIRAAFPTHRVLAEESGSHQGDPEHRWIVDPLDGTRGFSRGGAFWGPLVAYEHKGEVVAGAMALPVMKETYWAARGMGCFKDGTRMRVSSISDWSEATLSVGELAHLMKPPFFEGVVDLIRTAASTRGYGDSGGCSMLLQGRCELWIEAGVKTWDLAPAKILVEEAGGRFTDIDGKPTIESGHCAASNGLLHAHVLQAMKRPVS
jgi:histidinol-phosphatase